MLTRRNMLKAALRKRAVHIIYDNGVTAGGYLFAESGAYGAKNGKHNNSRIEFQEDCIFVKGYDNSTSNSYGISICEQTGLKRELLTQFSTINFECKTTQTEHDSIYEKEVAVYSGNTDISTATAICPIAIATAKEAPDYTVYSISVSDVLEQGEDIDIFYVGAGVRTITYKSPGEQAIYIRKIWLE